MCVIVRGMETLEPNPIVAALNEAISIAGSQRALADRITKPGLNVGQSTVSNWIARGVVPADYCPAIERETGVKCERLCPATDWVVLRKKRAA